MKQADHNSNALRRVLARVSGAIGLVLLVGLVLATSAFASFEQVGTWGDKPIELEGESLVNKELEGTRGLAVNVNGTGGVPAGTVYRVGRGFGNPGVTRYGPRGELLGHWGVSNAVEGVAVDQSTGNVYVLKGANSGDLIDVYNADGSELITSFGERAAVGETVNESPEKIHAAFASSLAVSSAGDVYVADAPSGEPGAWRVMAFEPQAPNDFSHYVYAGQSHDIAVGAGGEELAIDGAGNLYLNAESQTSIEEYAPANPSTPICRFETPGRKGGILGMTVDPVSGEVFYFSGRDTKFHQLRSCNAEGKLEEQTALEFSGSPRPFQVAGLAFNPSLAWDASRPAGVLYAADEEFHDKSGNRGQGYIFAPAEVHLPVIESESVFGVTSSTATLTAQINPKGTVTRYRFQYLADTAYQANEPSDRFAGALEAPLGGVTLGSGQVALTAAGAIFGLSPDTTYHYRVIASGCAPGEEGEVCETIGPGEAFRTFPNEASILPDGRAYELVSPVQKHGGEVFPLEPRVSSCAIACKPGSDASAVFPKQSAVDGESVVYQGFPFSASGGAAVLNEYLSKRGGSGWQTTTLSPSLQADGSGQGYKAFNDALTSGLTYQINPSLSSTAPEGFADLYAQPTADPLALTPLLETPPPNRPPGPSFQIAYAGASADLSHVFFAANDALTEQTAFAPPAIDGGPSKDNLYESVGGQLRLVNVLPGNAETIPGAVFVGPHGISKDGSRVFWSSETGQVYVRENAESTKAIPDAGKFVTASIDGSKLLLSDGHLFDLAGEEPIVDLTQGKGGFQAMIGQSEDLSSIYFVDTAALTSESEVNANGEHAEATKENLYYRHEGVTTFVARLIAKEQRVAQASPDGRWVALLSSARLTEFDNAGSCGEAGKLSACPEAYLFDSATGKLICASCDPSGGRPVGLTHLPMTEQRYLLDNGRLYFDTQNALSPSDTNGRVEDVYEYEPRGVGTCSREGGCVWLLSAGRESVDSNFFAIDSRAKNVFFTTRDRLVPRDHDELIDVYDAREGGGIAAESELPPAECRGEACQGPIVGSGAQAPPGSTVFSGPGNLVSGLGASSLKQASVAPKRRTPAQLRAQRLARALKACRSKARAKRKICETTARKRYSTKTSSKAVVKKTTRGGK